MAGATTPSRTIRPAQIAIALTLAVIAYFCVLTFVWNSDRQASDIGIWSPVPDDPNVTMAQMRQAFQQQNGQLEPAQRTAILQATLRDVIEDDALFLRGLELVRAGQSDAALPILEQARKRNPRSREARILLLDSYINAGRVSDALGEVSVLSRLMPGARDTMVRAMAGMIMEPTSRDETLDALLGHELQQSVVQELAGSETDPRIVLASIRNFAGQAEEDESIARLAERGTRLLVDRGEIRSGHIIWHFFYGLDGSADGSEVHDASFDNLPGGPPFGWQLISGSAGLAEMDNGVLAVQYYGRERADFARQLITLSPGRYRLVSDIDGNASDGPSGLRWQLSCLGGRNQLLSQPVSANRARAVFEIPQSDCPAQWLALASRPSDFSNPQSIRIESVSIEAIGS